MFVSEPLTLSKIYQCSTICKRIGKLKETPNSATLILSHTTKQSNNVTKYFQVSKKKTKTEECIFLFPKHYTKIK